MNKVKSDLITVIIPAYNAEKYISKTIESVLNQTYNNIEIIIIDDGSTDKTASIVKSYENKVKYIYQENSGVSSARNNGIALAKGNYIAFLDSDDYVLPKMYEKLLESATSNDADIVICNVLLENSFGVKKIAFKKLNFIADLSKASNLKKAFKSIGNSSWNKLFKRELISNIKFPNIKRGEDALFVLEAMLNSSKIVFIPDALYVYFQNNQSVTNSVINEKVIDNFIFTNIEKRKLIKKYDKEKELDQPLIDHDYFYFNMYTNKIRKIKDAKQKAILWDKWLKKNKEEFLKKTSLKYILFFSSNINWVYYSGMIITGNFFNPVLDRIKNKKFYTNK